MHEAATTSEQTLARMQFSWGRGFQKKVLTVQLCACKYETADGSRRGFLQSASTMG
jgi:hypothetical protein